jgi:multidrug efflux pump subunit AcrA (membrane-fusion protein)
MHVWVPNLCAIGGLRAYRLSQGGLEPVGCASWQGGAWLISYKIRKTVNRPAAVKLEAYPFTRYGYLKGHVDRTAADAVTDERRGLVFPVRKREESQTLSADRGQSGEKISNAGQALALTPGMAASVEITTGDRRIIDFVLSPIAKATSEAGRER